MNKAVNAVAVVVWALSGVLFVIAAMVDARESSPSITVVDGRGISSPLDDVLPQGGIGMILIAAPDPPSLASNVGSDVTDDGWHKSSKPETLKPETSPPKKTSTQRSLPSQSLSSKTPSKKSAEKPAAASPADLPCVDVNTADESSLTTLKGIGPALAAGIIQHRLDRGPFTSKDDLLNVKGIGPAKLSAISDRVCDF